MTKQFWQALATFTSMIIGAGLFALPKMISQAGLLLGLLEILVIGVLMILSTLCLGEVLLRTKEDHQMYGLAKKYLGNTGGKIMLVAFTAGALGALSAYIIGEAESINIIFGVNKTLVGASYWILFSILLFFGLKIFAKTEVLMNILKVSFFCLLFIAATKIPSSYDNLTKINLNNFFMPITTIIFAFLGFSALPEVKEELKGNLKNLKKVIISSYGIAAIVYCLFSFIVILKTSSFLSLKELFQSPNGFYFVLFLKVFEIITLATATFALGFAFKETLIEDLKMNNINAWTITIILPPTISIIFRNFELLISIVGAITGGLLGILTILMHRKAKIHGERQPEYEIKTNFFVDMILVAFFLFAIISEIIMLLT